MNYINVRAFGKNGEELENKTILIKDFVTMFVYTKEEIVKRKIYSVECIEKDDAGEFVRKFGYHYGPEGSPTSGHSEYKDGTGAISCFDTPEEDPEVCESRNKKRRAHWRNILENGNA